MSRVKKACFRQVDGSSIVEFAPALLVIFLLIFFPMLDLMTLALEYGCGVQLNNVQLREAAVTKASNSRSTTSPIKDNTASVVAAWRQTGLGKFAKVKGRISTQVNYDYAVPPPANPGAGLAPVPNYPVNLLNITVQVVTTLTVDPFLTIPFIPGVPGLSSPATFTYTSKQLLEDPNSYDLQTAGPAAPALPDNDGGS